MPAPRLPDPDTLTTATERLYRAFAVYPRGDVAGCPHCVDAVDHACIRSAPLRLLTAEHVGRYAFKAMTTWGVEADYKHFLPRLLELAARSPEARSQPGLEPGHVGEKILSAGWLDWPELERQAVSQFLLAWWQLELATSESGVRIQALFEASAALLADVGPLFDAWQHDPRVEATRHLAEFIVANDDALFAVGRRRAEHRRFWDQHAAAATHTRDWLLAPRTLARLEQAFFAHEDAAVAQAFDALAARHRRSSRR